MFFVSDLVRYKALRTKMNYSINNKPAFIYITALGGILFIVVTIYYTLVSHDFYSWYKYQILIEPTNKTLNNGTESLIVANSSLHNSPPIDYSKHKDDDTFLAGEYFESGFSEPCQKTCQNFGGNLKIIALVISAPDNHLARMGIRQTWGHFTNRKDVSIAFLLGTTNDMNVNKLLVQESAVYSDIIFANFHENYDNLTLKTMAMLQWVTEYCPKAKYLLKVDDDMFINMPRLLEFVNEHIEDTNTIFGKLAHGWPPVRNNNSKYFLSDTQYLPKVFPDFVTGPSYLLPVSLAPSLFKASLKQPFLKLEDVFLTGLVAKSLNIKRVHVPDFTNDALSRKNDVCLIRHIISLHQVQFHEQFDYWMKLMNGQSCDNLYRKPRSSAIGGWRTSDQSEHWIIQLGILVLLLFSNLIG